ncbi:CPBP family intramembrane glutamic endopeptidase [Granulicella cerasi]|uniref:CPBP family intramembrane glutamic endopeptidase n=1 Tax=Granulicella cerasi TaxID=741063 RepID=A0ABW1Z899_9BACT|nr:type II CAAX endopeptidase family protein [Granulicella cerasi]
MTPNAPKPSQTRTLEFALFLIGLLWIFAANGIAERAAAGLTAHLSLSIFERLLRACFELLLLAFGFWLIESIVTKNGSLRGSNSLPARATAGKEFRMGLALGWGMVVVTALALMALGQLHPQFSLGGRAWGIAILSILAIAAGSLATEVALRGFLFRTLSRALGSASATLVLAVLIVLSSVFRDNASAWSMWGTFVFAILYSIAYLRTRALWLGWGLHFGWSVFAAVLFGFPIGGDANYSSLISSNVSGPEWWTGGAYGPEGSVLAVIVALLAMIVLYRMTRDLAWEYTFEAPEAAGYEMEAPPPAAHTAMERSFAPPPAPKPLVQILTATPQASSTVEAIDKHLRGEGEES